MKKYIISYRTSAAEEKRIGSLFKRFEDEDHFVEKLFEFHFENGLKAQIEVSSGPDGNVVNQKNTLINQKGKILKEEHLEAIIHGDFHFIFENAIYEIKIIQSELDE